MLDMLLSLPALAGCFWLLDRQDKRHQQQLTSARAQLDRLCQRIQAPQAAVHEHATRHTQPTDTPVIPLDDDDAYWDAPPSKEQLADDLMTAELEARVA